MKEYLKFPTKDCRISQTAGVYYNDTTKGSFGKYLDGENAPNPNNIVTSYSHYGNRANDIIPEDGKLLAPCSIECVFHDRKSDGKGGLCGVISVFNSKEQVKCADGTESFISIMCIHGGENVATCKDHYLRIGDIFEQDQWFYTMGNDMGIDKDGNIVTIEEHVHFQIQKGLHSGLSTDIPARYGLYTLPNDCFINDVFFNNDTEIIWTGDPVKWCFDYDLIDLPTLEATDKSDGWYSFDGNTYYVQNEECLTGKHTLLEPGGPDTAIYLFDKCGIMAKNGILTYENNEYYLYPDGKARVAEWFLYPSNTDNYYYAQANGILAKNQWVAAGSDWYYLGDDCIMARDCLVDGNNYYVDEDGVMQTGWVEVGSDWYYFNPGTVSGYATGEVLKNKWIAGSNCWYYVLSDGKMAVQCQIYDAGYKKYFAFAHDGACVNASGQDTMYDVETYPYKS